jgi:peptide/nickel transport system substrate-binding protein
LIGSFQVKKIPIGWAWHALCGEPRRAETGRAMAIRILGLVAALLALIGMTGGAAAGDKTLRVVPHADLKVLDPHTNTATITLMHGAMIYDTLFAWDSKIRARPQMVETFQISADRLVHTYTLRPGLKFHDGEPVTTKDVIASIKRWMVRNTIGQAMAKFVDKITASDDKTFIIHLKEPFAFVEFALGSLDSDIMRAQDAATDPFKPVTTTIGSGPFRFVRGEWNPGAKVVYEKNPDYVPRAEPADGMAGGKVVKLDRVEWIVLPDSFTRSSALQSGEVDLIDQLPHDQIAVLEKVPDIIIRPISPIESYGIIRPNSLYPPFNNPKARQALALIVDQNEYLSAAFADKRWWRPCWSFFVCDSPNGTEVGSEHDRQQNLERAKELLAEAGYKGEKIVMLTTQEIPSISALGEVTADNLRKIGVNVEIATSDWGTMVARRAKKDPPGQGGWNLFHTTVGGTQMFSPLTNFTINSACDGKNWFGWPCDPKTEELRMAYIRAADKGADQAALDALSKHLWQELPDIPVGQYTQPWAWRSNVTGVLRSPLMVFWNIDKD